MVLLLRTAVWAACLPLLWPPGVCPHHGPVELLTGTHVPEHPGEPCCPECHGADQSRLAEPAVTVALDLSAVPEPAFAPLPFAPPVQRPAPPPHPSPPLFLTLCRLAC